MSRRRAPPGRPASRRPRLTGSSWLPNACFQTAGPPPAASCRSSYAGPISTPPPGAVWVDGQLYAPTGTGGQLELWPPQGQRQPTENPPISIGWRADLSIQGTAGIDFNADLLLNLESGELDLLLGTGPTSGANVGVSWTTGPLLVENSPSNENTALELYYTGGDVPVVPLGLNLEFEVGGNPGGPSTYYLGASPIGFSGLQAGLHQGVSLNWLQVHLLDLPGY